MARSLTRRFHAATRPREEERDLEIEEDEGDRDEVVAHVELHARVLEGLEAAFVGEFSLSGRCGPEQKPMIWGQPDRHDLPG